MTHETVRLQRPNAETPWGFRLAGGRDYQESLNVQRVTPGSIASNELSQGDVIVAISNKDATFMTLTEANDIIKQCVNSLQLTVIRSGPAPSGSGNQSQVEADMQDAFRQFDAVSTSMARGPDNHAPMAYAPPSAANQVGTRYAPDLAPQRGLNNSWQPMSNSHSNYAPPPTHQSYNSGAPQFANNPNYYNSNTHIAPGYDGQDQYGVPSNTFQPISANQGQPGSYYNGGSGIHGNNCSISNNQPQQISYEVSQAPQPVGSTFVARSNSNSNPNVEFPSSQEPAPLVWKPPSADRSAEQQPQQQQPMGLQGGDHVTSSQPMGGAAAPPPPPPPPPPGPPPPLSIKSWKSPNPSDDTQNAYANHGPGSAFSARSPAYNANPDVNQSAQSFPTRLNQQLSNMHLNAAGRGQGHGGPGFTPQSPGLNPQSPAYNPAGPGFNPQSPGYVPQSPAYNPAASPTYGMTSPPPGAGPRSRTSSGGSGGTRRPGGDPTSPGSHVPDAVLNMASRSAPDKKPWAYAPDADSIREQRDKVRRRGPEVRLPSYQNMLNLPQFDDGLPKRGIQSPKTPPTTTPKPPLTSQNAEDGAALAVNLQYNTPINMYSADNVEEALRVSAGPLSPGGGKKDGRDITQSDVYKMIHGLDEQKQRPRMPPQYEGVERQQSREKTPGNTTDDETKFSGYNNRNTEIPSKAFQKLQRMTSNSDVIDTTSIRPKTTENSANLQQPVANYNEASIRYLGATNPSKSFKMLQSMTGSDSEGELNRPPSRGARRRRKPNSGPGSEVDEPQQNADDIVDIRYVGGAIPSRTFRFLQQCVGDTQAPSPPVGEESSASQDGVERPRTIKVVHLRKQQQQPTDSSVTEF